MFARAPLSGRPWRRRSQRMLPLLLGASLVALAALSDNLNADPADEIAEALASCQNEDKAAEPRARACTSLIGMPNADPDIRAEALLNRGIIKHEAGDLVGAIADYSEAIVLNPEYPALYAHRADAYEDKDDLKLALADLTTVIGYVPGDADAYASRGDIYVQLDDRDRAINDYRAALKLDPDNEQARKGLESLGVK